MGGREGEQGKKERRVNEVRWRSGRVHLVAFSLVSATASSDISTAQPYIWYIYIGRGDKERERKSRGVEEEVVWREREGRGNQKPET